MPLLVGVAMLAPASVLFACTLRVRGLVPFGLAVLTIASATIVFGTLLTSAFTAYRVGPMLGFQTAALVIAAVTWLLAGKPLPLVQWIRPALLLRSRGAGYLLYCCDNLTQAYHKEPPIPTGSSHDEKLGCRPLLLF